MTQRADQATQAALQAVEQNRLKAIERLNGHMTPDKKQISELAELLDMAHANHMTNREAAELLIKALMPAIATALRTARNEALEEAAERVDGIQSHWLDPHTDYAEGACYQLGCASNAIRNLKHKDGQT